MAGSTAAHRPGPHGPHGPQARRRCGFTLIEMLMAVAIIGTLAGLAMASYALYVVRAQLAQTLTDYGHIRSVVHVETKANQAHDLHLGSQPGEVPPALGTLLDRREFNGPDGLTLQLVDIPAQVYQSRGASCYGLVARASGDAGERRLRLLRNVLPHPMEEKVWLSPTEFLFPLDVGGCTPGGGSGGGGGDGGDGGNGSNGGGGTDWSDSGSSDNGNGTWSASSRICVVGSDGKPLNQGNNHVQIKVTETVTTWDGQTTERSYVTQLPLDESGCATFDKTGIPQASSGQEGVASVQFEVVDVLYYWPTDPDITWDGETPSTSITAP